MSVISIDVGRSSVKVFTGISPKSFPSLVGEGRTRELKTTYDKGFEMYYNGNHYFIGDLARYESDFYRSMMTDDKSHDDTLILALAAIHRANLTDVTIFTGLPVNMFNTDNKRKLRSLLIGTHDVTIDDVRRIIRVTDVKIVVEGGGAFWATPTDGLIRIIDAGAKTINYVTLKDRRYIDRASGTLPFGYDTNKTDNHEQIAARIAGDLGKRWRAGDCVRVCGGQAGQLSEHLRKYFTDVAPLPDALYANAIGFYRIGRSLLRD